MFDIAHLFRDVARKPFNDDRAATILLNRMIDAKDHREVLVPIRRLIATQHTVNDDFRSARVRHARDDPYRLPAVVRYQGSLYVVDGHHRIAAQADDGRAYAEVRLFDLDETWEAAPLLDEMMVQKRRQEA